MVTLTVFCPTAFPVAPVAEALSVAVTVTVAEPIALETLSAETAPVVALMTKPSAVLAEVSVQAIVLVAPVAEAVNRAVDVPCV